MSYTPVESQIPNTTMKAYYNSSNVLRKYYIYPAEGYALHHNNYDEHVIDEEGNETGEVIQKFTTAFTTVVADYDFEANPDNIFAKLLIELDSNQFCGNPDNTPEVMGGVETDTKTE